MIKSFGALLAARSLTLMELLMQSTRSSFLISILMKAIFGSPFCAVLHGLVIMRCWFSVNYLRQDGVASCSVSPEDSLQPGNGYTRQSAPRADGKL